MYNQGFGEEPMLQQQQSNVSTSWNYQAAQGMQPMGDGGIDYMIERGEEITPAVQTLSSALLRTGFSIQFIALILMMTMYWTFGNFGLFTFDIYGNGGTLTQDRYYYAAISGLLCIYLVGVWFVAGFQHFVADNSKATRGFRTGSKLVNAATTMQVVVIALRLTQFMYAYWFLTEKWWGKFNQSKADWCLFSISVVIEAVSLIAYGFGLFYMESYADAGVGERYAWRMLFLFAGAGFTELSMVFTSFGSFYSVLLLAGLFVATQWALEFEPLLESASPELYSRDVNADVLPREGHEDMSIERNKNAHNYQPNFTYQMYGAGNNAQYPGGVEMPQYANVQ